LGPPHRCSDGLAVADGAWGPATEEDDAVNGLVDERLEGRGIVELRDRGAVPPRAEGEEKVEVLLRGYMLPEYDAKEWTC